MGGLGDRFIALFAASEDSVRATRVSTRLLALTSSLNLFAITIGERLPVLTSRRREDDKMTRKMPKVGRCNGTYRKLRLSTSAGRSSDDS